jgi:hypothetical protein
MRQQRCTTKSVSKCHKVIFFSFSGSSCNKPEHESKKHVCLTFSIVHHIYNKRIPTLYPMTTSENTKCHGHSVHPKKKSLVCVSLQVFVAMAWGIHPEL